MKVVGAFFDVDGTLCTGHIWRGVVVGTRLAMRDGRFTGGLSGPVCIDEHKASMTREYLARLGAEADYAASYAYADSTPDLALLEMVGRPVATHADSGLAEVAALRGWRRFPETQA